MISVRGMNGRLSTLAVVVNFVDHNNFTNTVHVTSWSFRQLGHPHQLQIARIQVPQAVRVLEYVDIITTANADEDYAAIRDKCLSLIVVTQGSVNSHLSGFCA
jgi:hypothetical protein